MSFKTVPFEVCECGKRGWHDENTAQKALGRAQAKRERGAVSRGTRRGMEREGRAYACPSGMYHLTAQSRRAFNESLVSA